MKLKFLRDYQGTVTDDVFFKAGVHDLPNEVALLYLDRAGSQYTEEGCPCVEDKPKPKAKPKPAPKKK